MFLEVSITIFHPFVSSSFRAKKDAMKAKSWSYTFVQFLFPPGSMERILCSLSVLVGRSLGIHDFRVCCWSPIKAEKNPWWFFPPPPRFLLVIFPWEILNRLAIFHPGGETSRFQVAHFFKAIFNPKSTAVAHYGLIKRLLTIIRIQL